MRKLFFYELRRLVLNRLFFGIAGILLVYGWLTLRSVTILGTAGTAPFSPWSFGDYLARLLPVLCLGELFFLSFFTSRQERRVSAITRATPVSRRKYAALRCGAVLAGTALLVLGTVGLYGVFCLRLFHRAETAGWALALALTLPVPVWLCLGLGWALGRVHPALVYVLMAVVFPLSWAPLPDAVSFSLGSFFTAYPLTLETLDPSFAVPAGVWGGRIAYWALGTVFLLLGFRAEREPRD